MENPTELGSIVVELKEILSEFECCIISEMLTDCNTALENSAERKALWQIKDRGERSLQTTQGMVHFTHTRFIQKETGETAYLLDDTMRALIAPVPVPGKRTFGMTKEALYRHYENKL